MAVRPVLFFALTTVAVFGEQIDYHPCVEIGSYGTNITVNVSSTVEYIIHFEDSATAFPYNVYTWSDEATSEYPILIMTRQQKEATSWEIPLMVPSRQGVLNFTTVSRTLCHNDVNVITNVLRHKNGTYQKLQQKTFHKQLAVSISTYSPVLRNVTIRVEDQTNFYLEEDHNYTVTISPSEPRFFFYKHRVDLVDASVFLEVVSDDDTCFVVSLQETPCPVFDLNEDIDFEGEYQTVNTKGGIIVKRNSFPDGMFIVFVAKPDNYDCDKGNIISNVGRAQLKALNHTSVVNFTIKAIIPGDRYWVISLLTVAVYLVIYIIFVIISYEYWKRKWDNMQPRRRNDGRVLVNRVNADNEDEGLIQQPRRRNDGRVLVNPENAEDEEEDLIPDCVYLHELAQNHPEHIKRESMNYFIHVMTIGVIYAIPVVQLVITDLRMVSITGNLDMCYYNFFCAHPHMGLNDFNHSFSNIGYIILGLVFVNIARNHQKHRPANELGIPPHYGLFYAMGTALLMEGLLSFCYHICPNQSNFQFDTTFMYILAVLCIVKLYQNRHPDINVTAYVTFFIVSVGMLIAMAGILFGYRGLWITFITFYSMLSVYMGLKVYYLNQIGRGLEAIRRTRRFLAAITPRNKARFTCVFVVTIANILGAHLGYLLYAHHVDFGTFLLALLMGNTLLYTAIYLVMKILVYREGIWKEPLLYLGVAALLWGGALICFLHSATQSQTSPAGSRQINSQCEFFGFYDFHDMWHMLSAGALFFSFMFLLTVDDNMVMVRRDEIVVF